jgi:hypothetical protein
MTYPVRKGFVQISSVHGAAICKEIGERLQIALNRVSVRLPSRLAKLMAQLRDDRSRNSADPSA